MESEPVTNMSETDLCNSPPDCDDGELTDIGQEDILCLETEHGLENRSSSTENITSQIDDCSYYISWIVYIALAVPRGKFDTQNT